MKIAVISCIHGNIEALEAVLLDSDRYSVDQIYCLGDLLDCLLIHGSSVSVSDELTPDTPSIQMLDRLMRMDANTLFCGRSGLTFQYEIQHGSTTSRITTLEGAASPQATVITPRQVIGVGNVGQILGQATYTLYNPSTNQVEFRTVRYDSEKGRESLFTPCALE